VTFETFPVQDGCILYRLHTDCTSVNLEKLTFDTSGVSFEKWSTLKCCGFHWSSGMWCCVVLSILEDVSNLPTRTDLKHS
jgi:hypothetical protein